MQYMGPNARLTGDARSANQPGGGESYDEPRKLMPSPRAASG